MKPLSNGMEKRRQVAVRGDGLGYLEQGAILFNRSYFFGLICRYFTHEVELSIVTRIGSSEDASFPSTLGLPRDAWLHVRFQTQRGGAGLTTVFPFCWQGRRL
jgi:hypothetical protein